MKRKTRLVALILALAMLLCALPLSIFAAEDAEPQAQAEQSQTELTLDSVGVSLGSKIALDFYVSADADTIASLRSKLTVGDEVSVNPLSAATALPNGVKISALLSSIELASNVTLELIDADGKAVEFNTPSAKDAVTSYTYSVKQYAESVLSDNTFSDKTKAAIKALVAYGIYAERFFLDTDSALTELLTEEEIANVANADFGTVITDKGAETLIDEKLNTVISADGDNSFLGNIRLVLDSFVKIRIELNCSEAPTVASDNALVEVGSKDGAYYVDITKITARNLNTVYELEINGTKVTVSLLAVAKLVADDEPTYGEAFANLAKALYNYYHYSHAYESPNYFVYEDFSDSDINLDETSEEVVINNITYNINGQTGATLKTGKDENGRGYLLFSKSSSGKPMLKVESSNVGSIADMKANEISYEFSLSKDGSTKFLGIDEVLLKSNYGSHNLLKIYSDTEVVYYGTKAYENGKHKLGNVSSDIFTVRMVIDFENELFKFYNEGGEVIMERTILVSSVTAKATTGLEWKETLTSDLFSACSSADNLSGSIRIYGLKIAEGNIYDKSNGIIYNVGSGTLPENAPKTYTNDADTILPTPAHPTHVFEGWYTSPDFTPATKITRIPASTNGVVKVYAKWTKYFINEDFSDVEINLDESSPTTTINNITFGIKNQTGSSFKTAKDTNGNSYLVLNRNSNDGDPVFKVVQSSSTGYLANMTEKQVSYEFSFGTDGSNKFLGLEELCVESDLGKLNLLKVYGSDGEVVYYGTGSYSSTNVVTKVNLAGGITTIRLVIDFEAELIKFYDADGNVIMERTLPLPSNVASGLDWMASMEDAIFYARIQSNNWLGSTRFYGIKIAEGNIFE